MWHVIISLGWMMLLIVKNENWFQLFNRACFSIFVRRSLKALSLCQEIIRKNLLRKPSTWNMGKPHQGRWLPVWSVITAKLTQSHHHTSGLTKFWFADMMSSVMMGLLLLSLLLVVSSPQYALQAWSLSCCSFLPVPFTTCGSSFWAFADSGKS